MNVPCSSAFMLYMHFQVKCFSLQIAMNDCFDLTVYCKSCVVVDPGASASENGMLQPAALQPGGLTMTASGGDIVMTIPAIFTNTEQHELLNRMTSGGLHASYR